MKSENISKLISVMSFSLKKITQKTTKILATTMLAIMLSGFFVNGSTPSKDVGQNSSKISYGYNLVNHTYAAGEAKAGATNNDE